MPEDKVRVNPQSVEQYGSTAQQQFDAIRQELVRLVDDSVQVDYFGPNAVSFKTQCGQKAADFGLQFSRDLGEIANAVRVSTSNIAQALGGRSISISVNGAPIPLPAVPQGDGSVEMSTAGLTTLVGQVGGHFSAINAALDNHLRSLQATDWLGNAKDGAVQAVGQFTTRAKNDATNAQQAISKYINDQIQAVHSADQVRS